MRLGTKVLPLRELAVKSESAESGGRIETMLRLHQEVMSDFVTRVLALPATEVIKDEAAANALSAANATSKAQLDALREILTLHQLQLETLIETLRVSNEAESKSRAELVAVLRERGRISDLKVSYDNQGRVTSMSPVYRSF